MTPFERALAASIRQTIGRAYGEVSEFEALTHDGGMLGYTPPELEEAKQDKQLSLASYVEKLFRDVKILAERLGLPATVADITKATPTPEEASALTWSSEGDADSVHIPVAAKFFESLEALTDGKDVTGLKIFETILSSTPKVITAFGLQPSNEKGVQDAMMKALQFAFPDLVREVPIPKNIKTYKPDFGVRSLHAAVEYKFIDSEAEAKKALDETYTDMKGYGGTFEWRHFYAVYYMTDTFLTQREVDDEYKLVKAERNWTPLVVVGRGARKPTGKGALKKKAEVAANKKAKAVKKAPGN